MPEIKTTATDTLEQDKKCHSNPPRVTSAAFVDEGEQLMIRRNIGTCLVISTSKSISLILIARASTVLIAPLAAPTRRYVFNSCLLHLSKSTLISPASIACSGWAGVLGMVQLAWDNFDFMST
jgi:hypothetical protein